MNKFNFMIPLLLCQCYFLSGQNVDAIFKQKIKDCLGASSFNVLHELVLEIDQRIQQSNEADNSYYAFANAWCNDQIEASFFDIEPGSELDELVKNALVLGYWEMDEIAWGNGSNYASKDLPTSPPKGTLEADPSTIESIHLGAGSAIVRCFQQYTPNRKIAEHYELYFLNGYAKSKMKLCELFIYKDIKEEEYQQLSVKYFVVIEAVLQKMLHHNGYGVYFKGG